MAKYKQSRKDRRDESVGMKKHAKKREARRMDEGFMGMLSEDHRAPANLPQHVVHSYYPEERYMDKYELDDTIVGIDHYIGDSVEKLEEYPSKGMY